MAKHQPKRRVFTAQEKLNLVQSHLVGKKPVSAICEENGIAPSLFYKWQQALFDHGAEALERRTEGHRAKRESNEIRRLRAELEKTQAQLANKHEVLSELMSEYIGLKKSLGD